MSNGAGKEGIFVMGRCVGFLAEPWSRNGKSGTNYRLGISRTYADRWGTEVTDVMQVDCAQDGAEKFGKQAAMLKDQPVAIRVFPIAKTGGRTGAFFTLFAPKESDLIPQSGLLSDAPKTPSMAKVG